MDISIQVPSNAKLFKDVRLGEVFVYNGVVYLKTSHIGGWPISKVPLCNALNFAPENSVHIVSSIMVNI